VIPLDGIGLVILNIFAEVRADASVLDGERTGFTEQQEMTRTRTAGCGYRLWPQQRAGCAKGAR
jgi:hypothetical protein